jgi:hypothetical protein
MLCLVEGGENVAVAATFVMVYGVTMKSGLIV